MVANWTIIFMISGTNFSAADAHFDSGNFPTETKWHKR